jgi:hypothetical protein
VVITMTHLSPEQLIDVAEGTAAGVDVLHAASCEACRRQVDELREALRLTGEDPIPEPSPLFWGHLAARIGAAVREVPAPRSWWRTWGWQWAPVGMVAALAFTAGMAVLLWNGPVRNVPAGPAPVASAAPIPAVADSVEGTAETDDSSWTLVSDLSADVALDDAISSGVLPAPGGADRALWQLSDAERGELAKILQAEMARPASADPMNPGV